jgi:hypothetical protein
MDRMGKIPLQCQKLVIGYKLHWWISRASKWDKRRRKKLALFNMEIFSVSDTHSIFTMFSWFSFARCLTSVSRISLTFLIAITWLLSLPEKTAPCAPLPTHSRSKNSDATNDKMLKGQKPKKITRYNFKRNFPTAISLLLLIIQYMRFSYQCKNGSHATENSPNILRPSQLFCCGWARDATWVCFHVRLHPYKSLIYARISFAYFAHKK